MNLNTSFVKPYINNSKFQEYEKSIENIYKQHINPSFPYSEWIDYPFKIKTREILNYINEIKKENKIMIVLGIGGSYLGAKAAIDMLSLENNNVYFIGPSMDTVFLDKVLKLCEKEDFVLNVISKSGTTMETTMYFEIFEKVLKNKYEENWYKHICCTTSNIGKLYETAIENNYKIFYLPENIGGRFSVLSNVGLIPMAFAGINIEEIIEGSKEAIYHLVNPLNDTGKYAIIRNMLYKNDYKVEMFVSYFPYFNSFIEWLKQLFGESEGKNLKGILPSSLEYPKDLHSLGQYMQEGERIVFETQFMIKNPQHIENKYIDEKYFKKVRNAISIGTAKAHSDGGVPVIIFEIEKLDSYTLGYLFYFFEMSCALSAYLLGINPFNQPGVEEYKKNVKELLA